MKKSIFAAVLGMAACAATSYGQGFVTFSSYLANNGLGANTSTFGTGTAVPDGYTAILYYSLGTVVDSVNNSSIDSITSGVTGLQLLSGVSATYSGGYFTLAGDVSIPGYTSGPVTFEVVAYNGASLAASTTWGRSGAFTMTSISPGGAVPTPVLGDTGTGFPNFFVATPVPEPTTLALAGFGGLAALVAFRRKQA